jgi:hypothetical protein
VLGSLRDDDQVTGVDHLLLSGDDGLALTLREDQVLVDVVNLQRQSRSDHVIELAIEQVQSCIKRKRLGSPLHRCLRQRGWSSQPAEKIDQSTRPDGTPHSWRGTRWSSWGSVASDRTRSGKRLLLYDGRARDRGLTFFSGSDILLADTENARADEDSRFGDVRARQLFRRGQGRAMMGEGDVRRRQGDRAVSVVFRMGVAMVRLEMDENIL